MSIEHPTLMERFRASELYRSVVRTPAADTPVGRALHSFGNVFLHLYPVRVPERLLHWRSTWRLGFISTVLFVLLLITGTYLMFFYTPAVTMAYGDMQTLRTIVGFGQLIRNTHRWAAHLMVLAVFLHMARVFVDAGYKTPRQFNWVIGVALLVVTLAYSFTGYLLPWDQLSYWAVTVGSGLLQYVPGIGSTLRDFLLGGPQIGQSTLLRFYVLHIAVLTIAFGLFFAVHLWRVRKDGFALEDTEPRQPSAPSGAVRALGVVTRTEAARAERASGEQGGTVFCWPHLIVRHQVVALAVCVVVVAMGIAWEAPLRDLANPNVTPEPAKAPWYFVGLQELLAHFHPLIAGVLVPAAIVVGLAVLPYVDTTKGRLPRERRTALIAFGICCLLAVVFTVIGAFFRGPGWQFIPPWVHLYFEP